MRGIVTGSSGFIGAALTKKLLSAGWTILGIDSHTDYYSIALKELRNEELHRHSNFSFAPIDLIDANALEDIIKKFQPDTVFHLAAQAGVRIPVEGIHRYTESNLTGFSNMLQLSIKHSVPNFLYASSSSVYGDFAQLPYVETELKLKPSSFYGATKLSNEILTRPLVAGSKTRARGMRFFTVYGPMGRPDMAYFRIISSLISGSKFELYGDGLVERDFTYIDDCVEMIKRLQSELTTREVGFADVVNVGGGHPVSMKELIRLTTEELGMQLEIKQVDSNPNDAARTMADPAYLKELVGAKPETSLKSGLSKTIDWASKKVSPSQLFEWVNSSS
jgi:UDP-glucuronate 4-epimerase